jgi:hypothetical protein
MIALGFLVSANLRIAIATITVFSQSFESLTFVFFVMEEIIWVVLLTIYYLCSHSMIRTLGRESS